MIGKKTEIISEDKIIECKNKIYDKSWKRKDQNDVPSDIESIYVIDYISEDSTENAKYYSQIPEDK